MVEILSLEVRQETDFWRHFPLSSRITGYSEVIDLLDLVPTENLQSAFLEAARQHERKSLWHAKEIRRAEGELDFKFRPRSALHPANGGI